MDRSLDEIAAEMNSSQSSSHAISFGQDYEDRDYIGAPIRGPPSYSKRHAPYSTSRSSNSHDRGHSRRDRDMSAEAEELTSSRIFVANLSYGTTWQSLRDHMRKGILLLMSWSGTFGLAMYILNVFFSLSHIMYQAGSIAKCDIFKDNSGNSRVSHYNLMLCPCQYPSFFFFFVIL